MGVARNLVQRSRVVSFLFASFEGIGVSRTGRGGRQCSDSF